jgi:hypothetical protein
MGRRLANIDIEHPKILNRSAPIGASPDSGMRSSET